MNKILLFLIWWYTTGFSIGNILISLYFNIIKRNKKYDKSINSKYSYTKSLNKDTEAKVVARNLAASGLFYNKKVKDWYTDKYYRNRIEYIDKNKIKKDLDILIAREKENKIY